MKRPTRRSTLHLIALGVVAACLPALESSSWAAPKDGYITTGEGVRTKTVAIITAKVYAIRHEMKGPLPAKSKQAVVDADVDKRFSWTMLRDVDAEKIQKALKEAFAMNGYTDHAKIAQFTAAFDKELKEKSGVSISYNAANKAVSVWVQGGGSATVAGADFMKAVWSIWLGKIDQPSLGDALISKM